ncbi:hypothetical protein [Cytobacillus firmus]|uniref:hypothetical protein n=1 Tax=Cytobacillus firmus TaxID=1399 RepID=UPI001CFF3DE9|nr:hypothetical protein [Cytobacillus firmus]
MRQFTKGQTAVFLFVLAVLTVVSSPFWSWWLKQDQKLNVFILDKTVPDDSYREHKGLIWILNNEKYIKSDGDRYSIEADYSGFKPGMKNEYTIKPLPDNLEKYQVLYLADTYGVYEEEFYGSNPLGERSSNLYGGLQEEEVIQLEETLVSSKGKTLIAEFNTFASPSSDEARQRLTNLLNISWSGWIGRYFPDLSDNEVPIWVKEHYGDGNWGLKGPGLVFVNSNDYVVVVEESEMEGKGVEFRLTDKGEDFFGMKVGAPYRYWFDVIEARNADEVLAEYSLPLTKTGKSKLQNAGIPETFPAVIQHSNAAYSSYYFAGDYADEAEVPTIYQTRGLAKWKEHFSANDSFYWEAYVPMMKKVLQVKPQLANSKFTPEIDETNGIQFNSQTSEDYIQIMKNGTWEDLLIKGVNMGIAKPGHFPGETGITEAEYLRWFKAIGGMNANAIRIYTLHPPAFYEAFHKYNQIAEKPLFLFHGVWVNEETLVKEQDAFSDAVTKDFKNELEKMIDIIHGNAVIEERPGHASGEYTFDISPYVLGFMVGIEWDPEAVKGTNDKHKGLQQFSGEYFQTADASPFEIWLAEMMDYAVNYETSSYEWQHSMSFTNWVTTDLLEHPSEPSVKEDMVSVNPNHIKRADRFHAGLFASYHVYPYYPDFLNYEEKYVNYIDSKGEKNNYAGYLHDLIAVHEMPVMVAEFGVPSSRGMTHENVGDMNQGFHSEEEQGKINSRLFESIVSEGYAGGLVFSWQDEWFKRTWNTMDYDNPDRRPYWSNRQTNEQHFGLLSFEPGKNEAGIYVDGITGDWKKLNAKPVYSSGRKNSYLKEMYVHSDEEHLYIRLDYNHPIDLENETTRLLIDTIAEQGQTSIPVLTGKVKTDFGVDFMAEIGGQDKSRLLIDSYYDTFYYHYSHMLNMIPNESYANKKDNGVFHPIRLALNKELTIPSTGETKPFKSYETGNLQFGNANPAHEYFNSLTDISISRSKKVMEIRLPWALLNIKDPSQKEIAGDLWREGLAGSQTIEGLRISAVSEDRAGILDSFPKMQDGVLHGKDSAYYSWEQWEEPDYHERLKKSYHIMKKSFDSAELGEK